MKKHGILLSAIFIAVLLLTSQVSTATRGGSEWIRATEAAAFPARQNHASVAFDGKMWVIGGEDSDTRFLGDVWNSSDGVTWTQVTATVPFPARTNPVAVAFNNRIWVIGGVAGRYPAYTTLNDVWNSSDGVTWTQVTANASFPARNGFSCVVFENRMWVIGGIVGTDPNYTNLNDVWSSSDGVVWTQLGVRSPFPARGFHSSVVFNNRIWVIGGKASAPNYESVPYADAWSSTNGSAWARATNAAQFESRYGHSSAVFDNRIWVVCGTVIRRSGSGASSFLANDVWSSSDGIQWSRTASNAFRVRETCGLVVFDGKLWVIGGSGVYSPQGGPPVGLNDVWFTAAGGN